MAELSLTINNKLIPPFSFSLEGDSSEYVLEDAVNYNDEVVALLTGDYAIGPDPYFKLNAGSDPDIEFLSVDIEDRKGDLYCPKKINGRVKKRRNLFAQVYGDSCLRLSYWKDYDNCPKESKVVLSIRIVGRVPPEKERRLNALSDFFQNNANGYFLRDPFHGHTLKEFDLIFRSGYTSYYDPIIELDCIKKLLDDRFFRHLRCVTRRPVEDFKKIRTLQPAARVRRLSPRSWRTINTRESDGVSVWEEKWIPSYHSRCNNVISTLLLKLHLRLCLIRSVLACSHEHADFEYRLAQAGAKKRGLKYAYEISQMETEYGALNEAIKLCESLLSHLQVVSCHPIFRFSEDRREVVFNVPASEFRRNEHYKYLYREILRFELTHFYWSGDRHSVFKLPSYRNSDSGRDFWIRKYSMQYEYWCYLRIHQTLIDLGFSATDSPDVNIMQKITYRNDKIQNDQIQITLFHDVHADRKYRQDANGLYPLLQLTTKTPDFALVFENLGDPEKTALLILDSKSDAFVASHMHENRNKYLLGARLVGKKRKARIPVLVQSWTILSGEEEEGEEIIECPPRVRKAFDEFSELNEDEKNAVHFLKWDAKGSRFLYQVPDDDMLEDAIGLGYLRTRIKCYNDKSETDHFRLFLDAQIKLMEQLLA